MREYLEKAIEVEMQRFGLSFTLMLASAGGSIGIVLNKGEEFISLLFALLGFGLASLSALFMLRSYIRINNLLEELKNV